MQLQLGTSISAPWVSSNPGVSQRTIFPSIFDPLFYKLTYTWDMNFVSDFIWGEDLI
jgi:hypothetical protein